jgi:hypothetical protein
MKTTDFFKNNRSAKKLNETLSRTFGKKIKFETFDTAKLEDARNKLRTQIYTARNDTGFNENLQNDTLTQAQWMHDAIVAELMDREEHVINDSQNEFDRFSDPDDRDDSEDFDPASSYSDEHDDPDPNEYGREGAMAKDQLSNADDAASELMSILDDADDLPEWVQAKITKAVDYLDTSRDYMKSKHSQGVTPMENESYKRGKKTESYKRGNGMKKLNEGEIQQASAIVTAKTMVDRVGRWIEELSSMENDTLLQLGDSIRDEMGQDQARNFIEACAPSIQQALETLKATRDTLSENVRALATGEVGSPDNMLGSDPAGGMDSGMGGDPAGGMDSGMGGDNMGMAPPDAMNATDNFSASEPAVGGVENAGRAQRESIEYANGLLRVLAG